MHSHCGGDPRSDSAALALPGVDPAPRAQPSQRGVASVHPSPPESCGSPARLGRIARGIARVVLLVSLGTLAVLGLVTPVVAGPPAAWGATAPSEAISLLHQTTWVRPGGLFQAAVGLRGSVPRSQLQVAVTLFPPLGSRDAFLASLHNEEGTGPMAGPVYSAATALPVRAGGVVVTVGLDVGGLVPPGQPTLSAACSVDCEGVYPVQIQLLDTVSGTLLSTLTTQLVLVSPTTDRLGVSWVLPVGTDPVAARGGQLTEPPSAVAQLARIANALAGGKGGLPSILPNPAALEALAQSPTLAERGVLETLASWAGAHPRLVLAAPFAPVDPPAVAGAGRAGDIPAQRELGAQLEASLLGVTPLSSVSVVEGPIQPGPLALAAPGHPKLVVPEDDLAPVQQNLTVDQPFALTVGRGQYEAAQADQTLESELPVGAAAIDRDVHVLAADLAQIYFEAPNAVTRRGVVLVVPRQLAVDPAFVTQFMAALATSPILQTLSLPSFFAQVPPLHAPARTLSTSQPRAPALPARALDRSAQLLRSLASTAPSAGQTVGALHRLLLLAESSALATTERNTLLAAIASGVDQALGSVSVAGERTLTLTSHTGRIPITLVSSADTPLRVRVVLESSQLLFPLAAAKTVTLHRGTNTVFFVLAARSTGDFPLQVHVGAPAGGLVLTSATLVIRSTAASLVAVALTVGAAGFLVLWWGRSIAKGRRTRNRRLVRGAAAGAGALPAPER